MCELENGVVISRDVSIVGWPRPYPTLCFEIVSIEIDKYYHRKLKLIITHFRQFKLSCTGRSIEPRSWAAGYRSKQGKARFEISLAKSSRDKFRTHQSPSVATASTLHTSSSCRIPSQKVRFVVSDLFIDTQSNSPGEAPETRPAKGIRPFRPI